MTRVLKMLAGGGLAAVLGMVLFGLSGGFTADGAEAQAPPARPARFVGTVTIDGAPAPDGTVVEARIGTASCGVTAVGGAAGAGRYVLDVQAFEPSGVNCGTDGATVSFVVGGRPATVSGDSSWTDYELNTANLAVVTATASPSPSASASPSGTATATATPRAPQTGNGIAGDGSSNAWMFAVLGVAALAFGVGGAAIARRGR